MKSGPMGNLGRDAFLEEEFEETKMKNIYSAFVKAQTQFAPALKASTNPQFKSKYVDLAGCVEAVLDALNTNGIGLVQKTHQDETGVTVETVFIHLSGESLEAGRLHVPASKQDPQGYGSALTYARRYSLMAACGIAPEDDDGNAASRARQEPVKARAGVAQDVLATSPAMPKDMTDYLDDLAGQVKDAFATQGAQGAYERIDIEGLDNIQKIYLSTQLPSNVRNPITTYSRNLHAQKVPA